MESAVFAANGGERCEARASPCLGGFLLTVTETATGAEWSSWSPALDGAAEGFVAAFTDRAEEVLRELRRSA
jgi:hypothetical protein